VEGEIKSAVCQIRGGGKPLREYGIHGVQSKAPEKRLLDKFKDCEIVYIAFDPDAYRAEKHIDAKGVEHTGKITALETAKIIGIDRVRMIIPPYDAKLDDAILNGYNFLNAINMAVKPQVFWENMK
jgi:hypothetical protein